MAKALLARLLSRNDEIYIMFQLELFATFYGGWRLIVIKESVEGVRKFYGKLCRK
jgi:hypothetical protein